MPRESLKRRDARSLVLNSLVDLGQPFDEIPEKYEQFVEIADKRAFPVNMRTAIDRLSLNDAAKIGYMRGIYDAGQALHGKDKT